VGVEVEPGAECCPACPVADLAARGLGVAILSETIAAAHAARLRSAIITDVTIPADLSLIWKPPPTPAARSFLTHCRHAFTPAPPVHITGVPAASPLASSSLSGSGKHPPRPT
jgi:hypothetical protein